MKAAAAGFGAAEEVEEVADLVMAAELDWVRWKGCLVPADSDSRHSEVDCPEEPCRLP